MGKFYLRMIEIYFITTRCKQERKTEIMLSRLQIEHDHIRRTLNLLEMQFLDLCREKNPDYTLMRSILVYIQEYPEQAHHPLEDVIFSILIERTDDTKLMKELIADHNNLEVVTRKLRKLLESIDNEPEKKDELKQLLSKFISRQRQHLFIEEIKVYPLIKNVLTKSDWDHAQTIVQLKDDPVFGSRTQADYETLYREIENRNK